MAGTADRVAAPLPTVAHPAPVGAGVVALAGDWHGNRLWASARIADLGARGVRTVFQLGDFGVWPGPAGKRYLTAVEAACAAAGVTVYAVPGNHDDWARLESKKPRERDGLGELWWLSDHVAVFPRDPAGHRFTLAGRSFVALGGAPSLDYARRTEGRSWWPQEMIPAATAEAVAADGYADVMLAHDAPDRPWQTPKVAHICATNPFGWPLAALSYAAVGRARMTTAFEGVRPRVFAHGHYHVADTTTVQLPDVDYATTMHSLSDDGVGSNVMLLDLGTLTQVPMPPAPSPGGDQHG